MRLRRITIISKGYSKAFRPPPPPPHDADEERIPDAALAETALAARRRWRQHFGGLEGGREVALEHFLIEAQDRINQSAAADVAWPAPPDIRLVPTCADIRRLLMQAKPGKSPGMDGIPNEFGRIFAEVLSPHLHHLAWKTSWRGSEALGYKAGQAIWLCKGKGSFQECTSHRSILLLLVWSKIVHQALRPPMKSFFEHQAPSLQLGGKSQCTVMFGSQLIRGISRVATAASKTQFTLFADIASAFYCVIQRLVANTAATPDGFDPGTFLDSLQLSADEREALAGRLAEPSALAGRGASPGWKPSPAACKKGSRPGSSWADLIFAALIKRILLRRNELRAECAQVSRPPSFPWDGMRTFQACDDCSDHIEISEVVWADDLAIPRLTQPHQAACALGKASPGVLLPVVTSYRHLGSQQTPGGGLRAEIAYRISQARAASAEGRRKVYRNPAISLMRKAFILRSSVLPKLFFGAGSWGPVTKCERRSISGALWSFYRSLLGIGKMEDQHLDAHTCFALLQMPSPSTALRFQRLLYISQMLAVGPPELWACLRADRDHAELLSADLQWLHSYTWRTTGLPCPRQDWASWRIFISQTPGKYKGAVKRAQVLDVHRHTVLAALSGLHRALLLVCSPVCLVCRRAFHSRLAWAGHSARKHGYRSHAHLCATGSTCCACGRSYSSLGRLRRHLVSSPQCVLNWGRFVPDCNGRSDAPHPLAYPAAVPGCYQLEFEPSIRLDVVAGLLADLNAISPVSEDEAWAAISSYVEPLDALRATVSAWKSEDPSCADRSSTADNMLLLLDVDLLADTYQPCRPARAFPQDDAPVWTCPGRMAFAISGTPRTFRVEPPPPYVLRHDIPTSLRLREAVAHTTWLEATCRTVAHCVTAAASQPCRFVCPGVLSALGPAKDWLLAAGFQPMDFGFRTPCD
ncbi:unnamed protein product [Symbiodinium sp. CCMP2592]|nr:unnamed protein product [Symbiodinium sp. CCMP2592]